ncbi:MAG: ABC transporter permease [Thermofilum sp. ex4484_15]|nr:MAG: ABC transporter permease [Thermofilum sp. ex4484_15]
MVPVKYFAKTVAIRLLTLIIAIYITVVIANLGGFIDRIYIGQIRFNVESEIARNPSFANLPENLREKYINERVQAIIRSRGLDKPFIFRSFIYFRDALTLNLGRALILRSASGSSLVKDIILERLPQTVLLFTTGTIISALLGIYLSLYMAKSAGGTFDKSVTFFAITTSIVPPWFFGIIFILIFSFYLGLFPSGGMFSVPPPSTLLGYFRDILYHMALPLLAWVFNGLGAWAYVSRNILIQVSQEDYVVVARAKGLPERLVLSRYVLRPSLPPIVTNVALAIVNSLTGAIITETVFDWPGVGRLLYEAILSLDAPVVIGITVIYAYLYTLTVLALDLIYGLLDPRIRSSR